MTEIRVVACFAATLVACATAAVERPTILNRARTQPQTTVFNFSGELLVPPARGAVSLAVAVDSGNSAAIGKFSGSSQNQSFAIGPATVFTTQRKGKWVRGTLDDLQRGDAVTVRVRAPEPASMATLSEVEATAVRRLSRPPLSALYTFAGSILALDQNSLTLNVTGGNWLALKSMLGQPVDETFILGPGTLFAQAGHTATVMRPGDLQPRKEVWIRILGVREATLPELLQTPVIEVQR